MAQNSPPNGAHCRQTSSTLLLLLLLPCNLLLLNLDLLLMLRRPNTWLLGSLPNNPGRLLSARHHQRCMHRRTNAPPCKLTPWTPAWWMRLWRLLRRYAHSSTRAPCTLRTMLVMLLLHECEMLS